MSLDLRNVLKGLTTQAIVATLLERGGYRVNRLGIEELFSEVKHLDQQQYLQLGLPPQLRSLPDLLVSDLDMTRVFLVEVKYRLSFDNLEDLVDGLNKQRDHWPQTTVVFLLGKPFAAGGRFHQDHIRCLPPDRSPDELIRYQYADRAPQLDTPEQRWNSLPTLITAFPAFRESPAIAAYERQLAQIISTLPAW